MFPNVLESFGLKEDACNIRPFGAGLINHTWKIDCDGQAYILQQINHNVFRQPALIAENTDSLAVYLRHHAPHYLFVRPFPASDGKSLVYDGANGWFRLSPFVKGSHTVDVVGDPSLAYEAALQFGRFSRLLSGFPTGTLHYTLPDFHNLSLRYEQFTIALSQGDPARIEQCRRMIDDLQAFTPILRQYEQITRDPGFRLRVTHHDTKISNVLFDAQDKGLCVIDLDTVMPGYFISDLGDMMRTYLCPVSEEEKDFSLINIREEYFRAIVQGYLSEMRLELSEAEIRQIVYSGKFMIWMQALRFLTDHLNNDRYYGAAYEGHNFIRAGNQLVLLQRLAEKETILNEWIHAHIASPDSLQQR